MQKLVFPTLFNEDEVKSASMLVSCMDDSDAQLILDEVAGRMAIKSCKLHNPIGYLRSLVSAYQRNEFVPETALSIQKDRAYRKQVAEAVRYSNEVAEKNALKFLGLE